MAFKRLKKLRLSKAPGDLNISTQGVKQEYFVL
jgi:hypothetical protein